MVEGADSKRGLASLANRTSSRGCCGLGYGNQSQHRSLNGRPSADAYDNLCSLPNSLSVSQPYAHRHAYAHACTYPSAHPSAHAHADPYANANPNPHTHADAFPHARLQRRTIPKLGMAIPR